MKLFGLFWLLWLLLMGSEALSAPVIFDHPNPQTGANFGSGIASLGDVNGDGVPDLLVGAPSQDVGGNADQGQAYLISGATGALLHTLDNPSPQAGATFGASVASAGDIDGDGKSDLFIGAPKQNVGICQVGNTGGCSVGRAYIFSSADGALLLQLDHPDPQRGAFFGTAVASVGNKLVVGTPGQSVGVFVPSRVFVFNTSGSLLFTINDPNPGEVESEVGLTFGSVVASAGDINGDTVLDILVGDARQDVGGNADQGQVHVFSGANGGLLLTLNNPSPQAGGLFGASVVSVGDVNGDGKPDVLIGASSQDVGGNFNQGRAYLFSGADGVLIFALDNPTSQAGSDFGAAVASIGDLNGDAVPDLLIGAPGQTVSGNSGQGQAFVFSGADGSLLFTLDNPTAQMDARFGAAVASAGDIDGDGMADPLVAAPFQNVGANPLQGRVGLFESTVLVGGGPTNQAPVANAGPDQTVNEATTVALDGTGSSDPDGDTLTFSWVQTAGPAVTLSDPTSATPAFIAPEVSADTVLTFELTVSDGSLTSSDTVNITVLDVPAPASGVDLTGTFSKLTRRTRKGEDTLSFTLDVCNLGIEESRGAFKVKFYVSANTTLDGSDTLVFTKELKDKTSEGRIKPGNCTSVSGSVTVSGPTQGKFLIAHIDSDNQIVESNETNNFPFREIP